MRLIETTEIMSFADFYQMNTVMPVSSEISTRSQSQLSSSSESDTEQRTRRIKRKRQNNDTRTSDTRS